MVTFFKRRVQGPEIRLEDAVAANISELFLDNHKPVWTAGSLKVGAGIPDLLCASFSPEVKTLAQIDSIDINIIAYLHAIRWANAKTISIRIRQNQTPVITHLEKLTDLEILSSTMNSFSLVSRWRNVLSEIVCVEAKVNNWKIAIHQATRNLIFANRSFVALPENIAYRIKDETEFRKYGIGLLSVQKDNSIQVIRRARSTSPKVWFYYYNVARHLALDVNR